MRGEPNLFYYGYKCILLSRKANVNQQDTNRDAIKFAVL